MFEQHPDRVTHRDTWGRAPGGGTAGVTLLGGKGGEGKRREGGGR